MTLLPALVPVVTVAGGEQLQLGVQGREQHLLGHAHGVPAPGPEWLPAPHTQHQLNWPAWPWSGEQYKQRELRERRERRDLLEREMRETRERQRELPSTHRRGGGTVPARRLERERSQGRPCSRTDRRRACSYTWLGAGVPACCSDGWPC
jgi:hypothetical protein